MFYLTDLTDFFLLLHNIFTMNKSRLIRKTSRKVSRKVSRRRNLSQRRVSKKLSMKSKQRRMRKSLKGGKKDNPPTAYDIMKGYDIDW